MRIFLKTHTKRLMFHYQLFYSVQLAFLVLGSIFDGGVFQKILIFCYFKKNGVFAKNSWLNFLTNNVFIIHLRLLTILLKISCNLFTTLNFNKTYMKYKQSLKLLLATVAKSSCVAKF